MPLHPSLGTLNFNYRNPKNGRFFWNFFLPNIPNIPQSDEWNPITCVCGSPAPPHPPEGGGGAQGFRTHT